MELLTPSTPSPATSLYERTVTTTLENGLEIVLVPFGVAPVATVAVLYRVGSRNEGLGVTGSAHLLEHMLFKGTPNNNARVGRNYADMMLEIGASFNASTSYDRTFYYQTVPSGYIEFALELEADRMRDAFVADEDRRFEMTVVRNEFERGKSRPGSVLAIETVAAVFREHPYHHPPIGWQSDVESVSTDRLREMYHRFYRPDNATLLVVGAMDLASVMAAAERSFGAIERPGEPLEDVYTSEPAQTGERTVTVKWRGETDLLRLAYRGPSAVGERHVLAWPDLVRRASESGAIDDLAAFAMLDSILAGGPTSRLSRRLIDERLCTSVGAETWVRRDPGIFTIGATLAAGTEAARAIAVVETELAELAERGPDDAELLRAKRRHAASEAFRIENCASFAQALGEAQACGGWRIVAEFARAVERVASGDVQRVVAEYLHADARTIGRLVPGEPRTFSLPLVPLAAGSPPPRVEAARLPPPRDEKLVPFSDRIARGRLGERVDWIAVDQPSSGIVELRVRLEAGPSYAERPVLAAVGAAMLASGTIRRDRIEIERVLTEAGASRGYGCDSHGSSYDGRALRVAASCVRDGFDDVLAVLAEELTEPAFLQSELERIKLSFSTAARQSRTNGAARASDEFSALLFEANDPNFAASVDEVLADLETLGVDDVRAWYERVIRGASVTFAAAGALGGAEAFDRRLRAAFASSGLASAVAPALVRRPAARPPTERRSAIEIADARNVEIRIGRATELARTSEAWMPAFVANAILGGSSLSGRLGRRLRVDEGLTYGIGSAFTSVSRDPSPWRITLGTNPEHVERAIASVRDVLARFATDGPSDREIEAAKNGIAGSTILTTSTSDGIARMLARIAAFDLGDDYIDTQRERLERTGRTEIEAAISRYFAVEPLAVVTAGPLPPT